MIELIGTIVSILGGLATLYATYRFGRRKTNAEAKSNELENVEKAISIWRETAEFAEKQNKDMQTLIGQNIELLAQNKLLVKKIERLEKELKELQEIKRAS